MTNEQINRFLNYVDDSNDCWLWIGAKDQCGYGNFWLSGKVEKAHRVAYRIYKNKIPTKKHILHTCDNPGCVNPQHLFVGTNKDNVADRESKGRGAKGEKDGNTDLLNRDVIQIDRLLRQNIYNVKQIALIFNISADVIWRMQRGKSWSSVTGRTKEDGAYYGR